MRDRYFVAVVSMQSSAAQLRVTQSVWNQTSKLISTKSLKPLNPKLREATVGSLYGRGM